jgi:hypothetical protein
MGNKSYIMDVTHIVVGVYRGGSQYLSYRAYNVGIFGDKLD